MKIKVKLINPSCKIEQIKKGEWVDLRSSEKIDLSGPKAYKGAVSFKSKLIPLGIAMELPKHFEANIAPRSSSFRNYGIILSNSFGIIDSTYNGDNDEWQFNAIPFRDEYINEGDRIAQFRIRPSQFAPFWVKLKWLFTSKIKFEFVDNLGNKDRGGIGSTGVK